MVLIFALMIAAVGAFGVLVVSGLGWLLSRWLDMAPLIAAALLVVATVADVIFIRNMINQPGDSNSKAVMQIMAWGYGAPILLAMPCVLGLLRLASKR